MTSNTDPDSAGFRVEKDSMGDVQVPADALYAAQTQRAVDNFPISGIPFGRSFIRALGLIKSAAAQVNQDLGILDPKISAAIQSAADEVIEGRWDAHFPIDIFQTGSGTSTNMNANEVLATRAGQILGAPVHPNDHVNKSQSSNDVIPTAIHVAAFLETQEALLPAFKHLHRVLEVKAAECDDVVKTGRTHLMDAMPVRLSQEIGGWAGQIELAIERIEATLPRLGELAIGGTAVGTGINAPPEFSGQLAAVLSERSGGRFRETRNHFAAQATMDTAVELSGQLRAAAAGLMKIADDLRLMNSGPIAGLGEIALPSTQPGSSIMPGKVNPVICEATMMVAAQVMGNDVTVGVAGSRGNFQLNVMLPVIARNLLESLTILANASRVLADRAIAGFTVNRERIAGLVDKNPILVTALNNIIGYDLGAKIAKTAYAEGRTLKDVARELTDLSDEQLDEYLNPRPMTEGGVPGLSRRRIRIDADIRTAETLPGFVYTDPAVFDASREAIFARSWQFAGDIENLRAPGRICPMTLLEGFLDEPLLWTRDEADRLHCLSNVCTHRGNLVAADPGQARSLRCRYHGRRFRLDGTFQQMPEFEEARNFPTERDNLPRFQHGNWGPFLFASLEAPHELDGLLKPMKDRLGWLPLDEFRFDAGRSRDYLVKTNWALYCENYLEGFHIPFVHASLNDAVDYENYTTELHDFCSLQLAPARPGETAFDLPAASPDHGREIAAYYYWLFPNLMFNFYPWGLSINVVRPLAVDRTRVSFLSYVWREELLAAGAGAALDRVEREDEVIVEAVQRGMGSRAYAAGRYSPTREQGVHHFHRLLAERLDPA